jgi:UDP-3-O-[3-hydroxymyristoyl] glucosamine N-acyltransferase
VTAISLHELAELVGGRVVGDADLPIVGAATISRARQGEITLAENEKLVKELETSDASAVVVSEPCAQTPLPCIVVDNVHDAFAKIVTHFRPLRRTSKFLRSHRAQISESAELADDVHVHPFACIGDDVAIGAGSIIHSGVCIMDGCRIGENVTLFPNVVLYENTVVGNGSVIHAGAVIGAYGFGYQTVDGQHQRAAQLGYVEIGENVEIGASTTIDRGTYDATVIGHGTKVDNQVMIAHNCRIGPHNLICSQAGVAGSCKTGSYVVMAGQVGLSDHLDIGDRAILGAKAGVMNDVPADSVYIGIPATPERDQWKMWVHIKQLPKIQKQLKTLQLQLRQAAEADGSKQQQEAA